MKKKLVLLIALFAVVLSVNAADRGIKFFKGSFAEALELAKKEKKQIFIDFFTEWCGPCLNMAETVFILPEVAEVYNSKFVCLKIDAEKGEGAELAKKYKVASYPSYIFVNPKTSEMTHRSGGNKPVEDFIADTKGALNPKLSCFYLDAKYKEGNFDRAFLVDYLKMKKASGARDQAAQLFDELIKMGAKLTEKETWDLFVQCVSGYDNTYIMEVSNDYAKFVELYGKKEVDAKLESATAYAPAEFVEKLCDFDGKEYNMVMRKFSKLTQAKKYNEASVLMSEILTNKKFDQEKVIGQLAFTARISPSYNADETPYEWIVQQVEYLRYIAYNKYNRDDSRVHYEYAVGLEYLIKRSMAEGKPFPQHLLDTPKYGKDVYDTRPANLKPKPGTGKKRK